MGNIRQATSDDFEKVYPLLKSLYSGGLTKNDWQRLFVNHWGCPENFFGYVLVEKGEIVGFLGTIFSRQLINNSVYKFCNLSSWVVKKQYRAQSLLLLLEALKLEDYTLTDFTATKDAFIILKKLGFQPYETNLTWLPLNPIRSRLPNDYRLEWDPAKISHYLSGREQRIFEDHARFNCFHLLIHSPSGEWCYALLMRIKKKRCPFAMVHHVSNLDLFLKCRGVVNWTVWKKLKTLGLLIPKGMLNRNPVRYFFDIKMRQPRLFKSNVLQSEDISSLYSECFVLNQ